MSTRTLEQERTALKAKISTIIAGGGENGVTLNQINSKLSLSDTDVHTSRVGGYNFGSDVVEAIVGMLVMEGVVASGGSLGRYVINPNRNTAQAAPVTNTERNDYEARIAKLERDVAILMRLNGIPN